MKLQLETVSAGHFNATNTPTLHNLNNNIFSSCIEKGAYDGYTEEKCVNIYQIPVTKSIKAIRTNGVNTLNLQLIKMMFRSSVPPLYKIYFTPNCGTAAPVSPTS
jgi:hypothetical protein